jgi:hypothetical protein
MKKNHEDMDRSDAILPERLLRLSELSVWLDCYDDIFSDFDPRPYQQRALSDDFLAMARKEILKKTGGELELTFLLPHGIRDRKTEKLIKERLHGHFIRHAVRIRGEIAALRRRGGLMCLASFAMLFFAAYLPELAFPVALTRFLTVLCNPAGWYLVFSGLDQIFAKAAQQRPELVFHEKLAECQISFRDY